MELLKTASLRQLHLFESRSAAFGKDKVLQENVIVHAIKGERQLSQVVLSTSTGRLHSSIEERTVSFDQVVSLEDPEKFIHIGPEPTPTNLKAIVERLGVTLSDLGLTVSTGRVVDFRVKPFLRKEPDSNTVPLLYPAHFSDGVVSWPRMTSKKPNAIEINESTAELFVPSGFYVLVKRFSSKEERRRIVACVFDPEIVQASRVAFENHLNYFHIDGSGLPKTLASGLAAFLNSSFVDSYFRQFSGHTQVNATDLRKLKYPPKSALEHLGKSIYYPMTQSELDQALETGLT
jgi:adenine-specific DNA-methyltransferase